MSRRSPRGLGRRTSDRLTGTLIVRLHRRRRFATEVARAVAGTQADLATTEWSKARRRGVLLDASQNAKGKTIASVYSVRPMPRAPVSTPLHWDEVNWLEALIGVEHFVR